MSSLAIYEEFISDNMDKRYPLSDEGIGSGSFQIPDSFMVDLKISIGKMDYPSENSYRYTTFVSQLRVYSDYIYVQVSTVSDGIVAVSDPIPTKLTEADTLEDRTLTINPTTSLPINGTLVVGTCLDIAKHVGIWDINEDHGMIFPANIIVVPTSLTGLNVGGRLVTGDINLESGDGISIEYEEATNTIKFSIDPPEDAVITDDDLINIITKTYGKPVVSINGVPPDSFGNIQIDPTDCLMVDINPANSTISFYNPCGPTCASEDFMSDTYNRIVDLNKNVVTLTSFYNSVSNTLAQMGARVSALLEHKTGTPSDK